MCSKTYNRAGQQGKSTDSCPEITELHKDYITFKAGQNRDRVRNSGQFSARGDLVIFRGQAIKIRDGWSP